MLVLDTSAAIHALMHRPANTALLGRLAGEEDLGAPHLIDVEMLQALRRMTHVGEISADQAADLRTDFDDLPLQRYPHGGLSDRIWALRHNLTAYDAAYVALAELLGCPLITSDARLGRASGHNAKIEVYEPT